MICRQNIFLEFQEYFVPLLSVMRAKGFILLILLVVILCETAHGASVRRRYVPAADVEWGYGPELIEAEIVKPREVHFVHYGEIVEISSDVEIEKVEVYAINGSKLRVKRVRGTQVSVNTGDFDYGIYIVVTHFSDGSIPAVNKFIR